MNNPSVPLVDELRRIAAAGFDFVDLTLEPPCAWPVGEDALDFLRTAGLGVVGHTAPYLPIASPYDGLREAAHRILHSAFDAFALAGARLVNVHPNPLPSVFAPKVCIARNAEALASLAEEANRRGLRLMVENFGQTFTTVAELEPLFATSPLLGFHLDVGHANIGPPNRASELIARFADRLVHVHVHDNDGVGDLHLPIGAGTVPWTQVVGALRDCGYDGTVTIEVFSPERHHLEVSTRLWRRWWDASSA